MQYFLKKEKTHTFALPKFYQNYYNWYANKYFLRNIDVIGYPSLDKNKVYNFTDVSYVKTPFVFDTQNNAWEMVVSVITSDDVNSLQNIDGSNNTGTVTVINSGKIILYVSNDPYSWNIVNGAVSNLNILPNKKYLIRKKYTGNKYTVDVLSEESEDWVNYITVDSSLTMLATEKRFGNHIGTNPFKGVLILNESYIKINNNYWWVGAYSSDQPLIFNQPELNSNGDMGVSKFAVSATELNLGSSAYFAMQNTINNYWHSSAGSSPFNYGIYTQTPVKLTGIKFINRADDPNGVYPVQSLTVAGSKNQEGSFVEIFSKTTPSPSEPGASWEITIDEEEYYKWFIISLNTNVSYAAMSLIQLQGYCYDYIDEVLVAKNSRTYEGEYSNKILVNQIEGSSSDYDEIKIKRYMLRK